MVSRGVLVSIIVAEAASFSGALGEQKRIIATEFHTELKAERNK